MELLALDDDVCCDTRSTPLPGATEDAIDVPAFVCTKSNAVD